MQTGWKRFCAVFCLLAMFFAGGGHWLVLQSVAWGRMLVDYSRNASLSTAIEQTFDGEHPCPMCTQIKKGRTAEQQSEQKSPWASPTKAPEPMCLPAIVGVPPAKFVRLPHLGEAAVDLASWREPPPTPPPRNVPA